MKYVVAAGTETAQEMYGAYIIPADALSAIIESCLLGDVTGDGQLKVGENKELRDYVSACISEI